MDTSDIKNRALGLVQPDANLEVFLVLNGKEYEVVEFSTSFLQPTDTKGEPQKEVKGGKLQLSLAQFPDSQLFYWAISRWSRYNGEIVFRNQTNTAPLKIKFFNAYCIDLHQDTNSSQGTMIHLTISPEQLEVNNVSFDNLWEK